MNILSETLCHFGLHSWFLAQRGVQYDFYECRHCPAERMEKRGYEDGELNVV